MLGGGGGGLYMWEEERGDYLLMVEAGRHRCGRPSVLKCQES